MPQSCMFTVTILRLSDKSHAVHVDSEVKKLKVSLHPYLIGDTTFVWFAILNDDQPHTL